jgi:hypothetical protein
MNHYVLLVFLGYIYTILHSHDDDTVTENVVGKQARASSEKLTGQVCPYGCQVHQ